LLSKGYFPVLKKKWWGFSIPLPALISPSCIVGVRLKQPGHAQKFLREARPLVKVDVTRREAKKKERM
jgi:hypothetical protein